MHNLHLSLCIFNDARSTNFHLLFSLWYHPPIQAFLCIYHEVLWTDNVFLELFYIIDVLGEAIHKLLWNLYLSVHRLKTTPNDGQYTKWLLAMVIFLLSQFWCFACNLFMLVPSEVNSIDFLWYKTPSDNSVEHFKTSFQLSFILANIWMWSSDVT